MFRIDDPTAAVSLPTPEAAGTEGYFTEGNPSTATAATLVRASWLNRIQEELRAIVVAAGITPSKTIYNQVLSALQMMQTGSHGQCRLTLSGGNLLLSPFGGNGLAIAGTLQKIPSAGVSLAPAGLIASTLYYIYAYMNAGVMTLEASTTTHATDTTAGNIGVEIKSGDNSRTLVGMTYPVAGPAFADSAAQRLVASWFNPLSKTGSAAFTATRSTSSTSFVEINTEIRVSFVTFGTREVAVSIQGEFTNSISGTGGHTAAALAIDGVVQNESVAGDVVATGSGLPFSIAARKSLSEGFHYATLFGGVNGGTATYLGGGAPSASAVITTLDASING